MENAWFLQIKEMKKSQKRKNQKLKKSQNPQNQKLYFFSQDDFKI
jgi:hypothetical protein